MGILYHEKVISFYKIENDNYIEEVDSLVELIRNFK